MDREDKRGRCPWQGPATTQSIILFPLNSIAHLK